jgi:2-haloacid dehalogenase
MSPRAAWRLETLGFEQAYDYVGGKADWLAHALPREGGKASVPSAGDLVDAHPPTCALDEDLGTVRAALESSGYGFCLVVNERRIVLGRVRKSAIRDADPGASAESVMEPGPSTVRPSTPARELVDQLARNDLKTAIVTTPGGCLVGVFRRADAERRLRGHSTPTAERAVVFDVMGTLFDLSSLQARFVAVGAPPLALQAWFGRLLHHATSLTLAGDFRPFPEIAATTLRSVLARLKLDPERADDVLAGLSQLEAHPEARDAMERLAAQDIRMITLTNGSEENTRALLRRAGLDGYIERFVTAQEVRAYKPHPAPYRLALDALGLPAARATLIAAHAWDVVGARAVGMDAIWISRDEVLWPLPVPEARRAADLVQAAALVTASNRY